MHNHEDKDVHVLERENEHEHNHECGHCHEHEHEHGHDHDHEHEHEEMSLTEKVLTVLGLIVFVVGLVLSNSISVYLYIAAYLMIGYNIILNAVKHLFSADMFDENLIMTIATLGAMIIGEYPEGIAVLVLYKLGELLNDKAVDSSKDKIESVLNLKEEKTTLKDGTVVDTDEVKVGDIILVKTGDRVPLDATLEEGIATIDMSALNGESTYVDIQAGKEILSGSINVGNAIYLKVIREEKDSAVSKIVELVENASKNKSKTEKYVSKFCKIYTPIVIVLAILVVFGLPLGLNVAWKDAIYRALNFLVISCPCALIISIPLGFFVGMGASSKKGILAKGTVYLDTLTSVDTIFLDKTGTLTEGKFEVDTINSTSELSEEEILEYVAIAESKSNHPIAKSILEKYGKDVDETRITEHAEEAGFGIRTTIDSKVILCGNYKMLQKYEVEAEKSENPGTIIYLAIDGKFKGTITLNDVIKPGSKELVEALHKKGIKEVSMLTGDRKAAAEMVANKIGMDSVHYELLPQDKVTAIEDAKKQGKCVAFVGDGINDSPVIAASDVGMAMGRGSDIAVETADIVLMTDEPEKIVDAIAIARRTKGIVNQNIALILIVKVLFLVCSVLGLTTMWLAVFADVGITIITVLNSLRIFKVKNK